jgi:predicted regulator of Ras-like GTPase activity (Roadblock/LC7/MglB family)
MSLSALAAGAFASTREIARLVGETEFTVLFHKGKKEHVSVSHVDGDTLMMAIFDDKTTVGIVSLYSRGTEEKIAEVMSQSRSRQQGNPVGLAPLEVSENQDIFNPQDS